MKLPDFLTFEPLNELRRKMGGAALGDVVAVRLGDRLSIEELQQLSKQGIDIAPTDIKFLPDGTLAYKDRRVLIYIRDIIEYSREQRDLPRFHVAHCRTLDQMLNNNRFERYVVATRVDGIFNLKRKRLGEIKFAPVEVELDVCQNCLETLRWGDFSMRRSQLSRRAAVDAFSIAAFFDKYGTCLFKQTPKYSDQDAPLNEYTADFPTISNRLRSERNWTCENCGVNLSDLTERQYLHTHHRNGMKSDNSQGNLTALCVACHAQQPAHSQMRQSDDLRRFLASHPNRRSYRSQVA